MSAAPPASPSPQSAQYRFTFNFYRVDNPDNSVTDDPDEEVTVVLDEFDRTIAKEKAFDILAGRHYDSEPIRARFVSRGCYIGYEDPPWESWDAVEESLESIDGVSRVRYDDPYEGAYQAPRYLLNVSGDIETVISDVRSYYDGFDVEQSGDFVEVIVSPARI